MPGETHYTNSIADPLDEKKFQQAKAGLYNSAGLSYIDFKRSLNPVYFKVWRDIILGWICLIVIMITAWQLLLHGNIIGKIIISIVAAKIAGYIIAYLVNFFHEAAHYNIAVNKNRNDLLANLFIGILIGQGIKNYRIVHWQHHISLGEPNDTERSYFESLDLRFFILSLTGISALQFFLNRNKFVAANKRTTGNSLKKEKKVQLLISLLFHISILTTTIWFKQYWLAATWIMAIGCFYPFFNRLRQLIEHRSDNADKKADYSKTSHGKLSRIFGNTILDKTFGSAGFNKHMLHHLEPGISYTRLNELEIFLKETWLGESIKKTPVVLYQHF